ncbi:hypothetical protein F5141DRAFT_1097548 [Pisolithus sp. B1]|nr:hypothetical protein F5141DRAFT_1097548 [Pisolithus sp. B1]
MWKHTCCLVVWWAFLLIFQTNLQLIFVPQTDVCGQLMFVISTVVSWAYNTWLSHKKLKRPPSMRFLVTLVSANLYS